jgi:hypothetical protein
MADKPTKEEEPKTWKCACGARNDADLGACKRCGEQAR